jgi:tetratricopeptide (TPR) repeat protein
MNGNKQHLFAVFLLAAGVLVLYWPVTGFEFILMDDHLYLHDNPDIRKGLSWEGIAWAMTTLYATNWHPLTWLSLLADYECYGWNAAGYHVSNLLLHVLNTVLLFAALRRMTGETWKCFAVAALFGVHPLNIESVAWIAERKNLLSTLFLILTLFAYVRYVERPGWMRYLQSLFFFALGLMAKPMLVTVPFLLLLLDCWPLRRFQPLAEPVDHRPSQPVGAGLCLGRLLKEKLPFFVLSLGSALITLYAAKRGGAICSLEEIPFWSRIGSAAVSYAGYLKKMVWPVDLAIFYPYPAFRPAWHYGAAFVLVAAVSVFVVLKRRRHPYLVTGWLWYLVTLVPVIGFVQVGYQSMANRYAYIPLLGIFIMIVWGTSALRSVAALRRFLPAACGCLILIFLFSTWLQLPHWRDSEAAFSHAIKVTKDNFIAQSGLGDIWQNRGVFGMARLHYHEAIRIKPDFAQAHNNFSVMLFREGGIKEAEAGFREALKHKPDLAEAHNNLGEVLRVRKRFTEAAAHYSRALELKPGYVEAQNNLAQLIRDAKRSGEPNP